MQYSLVAKHLNRSGLVGNNLFEYTIFKQIQQIDNIHVPIALIDDDIVFN